MVAADESESAFRYHDLFADFLRERLRRDRPGIGTTCRYGPQARGGISGKTGCVTSWRERRGTEASGGDRARGSGVCGSGLCGYGAALDR